MIDLPTRSRYFLLMTAVLVWLIALAVVPSRCSAQLLVVTDTDPSFFPTSAEVIAATPENSGFGDDANVSLAQSFTVDGAFSLETIYLAYENDTGAPGDQTVTLTIFTVADVQAPTHDEPPLPGDVLFTESVTFPFVGGTDTIAGIRMDSPLALAPGGYAIRFSDTTSPGWEWLRTSSGSGGDVYPGGHAYENGEEKGVGDDARDFSLALSSMALPALPIDTFSIQSGDLLAGTTWENGLAPVGAPPEPNFFHNIVSGHTVTADGSSPYNGAGLKVVDGSLEYTASAVDLPSVNVAAGTTVTESTSGDFFLGDISAPTLGKMVLDGQMTITAEGGADAALDMEITGTGTAIVNVESGGLLFISSAADFMGTVQFNGTGDEALFTEADGGVGGVLEMNSTGINRLVYEGTDSAGGGTVVFNQLGQIDHRSFDDRLHGAAVLEVNADVTADLTTTYDGNERRLFFSNSVEGAANVTVHGTPTDPTNGSTTLNEFEVENTDEDSAGGLLLAGFSGTLTTQDFVNVELRREFLDAELVINENAQLDMGFRDIDSAFSVRLGDVTVNAGGRLEVGYEADDAHVPLELRLSSDGSRSGNLTLADGSTTIMQVSGTGENDFDRIVVDGTASLNGTLEVLVNPEVPSQTDTITEGPYVPTLGDTFDILTVGLSPASEADFDVNGAVDGDDFLIWQANFGTQSGATMSEGDANGDGKVDGDDFLIWQADFGLVGGGMGVLEGTFDALEVVDPDGALSGAGLQFRLNSSDSLVQLEVVAAGGAAAVPEPSTAALALAMAAMLGSCRRREKNSH